MQPIPVKKFEKLSSEMNIQGRAVVTKITDYRQDIVFYEVISGDTKSLFKTLEEARKHLAAIPKYSPKSTLSDYAHGAAAGTSTL